MSPSHVDDILLTRCAIELYFVHTHVNRNHHEIWNYPETLGVALRDDERDPNRDYLAETC